MNPQDQALVGQLRLLADNEVDAQFTARVMAEIGALQPARPGFWSQLVALFQQPIIRRLATVTSVPVAVFLAFVVVSFATRSSVADTQPKAIDYHASDMLSVELSVPAPAAEQVYLAGDFNGWSANSIALSDQDGDGVWSVTITLPRGNYAYQFVVDGSARVVEPGALPRRGEHGPFATLRL